MGFLVSAGVEVKEIDMTNSVPALSTSIGAYAGQFRWGPTDRIVTVGSEAELANIFGAPIEISTADTNASAFASSFLTAASFLKYGNTLRVSRAVDILGDIQATTAAQDAGYRSLIVSTDDLESSEIPAGYYAKYSGEFGNSLRIVTVNANNYDYVPVSSVTSALSYQPNTTEYASSIVAGDIKDEVSVIIIDSKGYFSGTVGGILEIFEGLSLAVNGKTMSGANNYINAVLNDQSQYIYSKNIEDIILATPGIAGTIRIAANMAALTPSAGTGYDELIGGSDGIIGEGDVSTALEIFDDAETVDINFLFAQNFDGPDQDIIDTQLIAIAENRKDIISFVSAPLSIANSYETNDAKTSDVVGKFSDLVSSYAVFDSSPVQVYNKYTDRYIWIPACGHIAGLCANSDLVSDPWVSPAGYTRGQLRGVVKLALNPTKSQRDDLYKGKVNPICSFPGQGIILYGDKTGVSKPSAFGHINVRRLFITLEKSIAAFSKFQLFELNDEFTRGSFRAAVEPFLRNVQARRGITDFRVVCDTTNNTGAIIDSNRFVADIYIKPTYSINFITLNFIATRTGVEFKEIVGA